MNLHNFTCYRQSIHFIVIILNLLDDKACHIRVVASQNSHSQFEFPSNLCVDWFFVLHLISSAQTPFETIPEMLGNQWRYRQRQLQFCRKQLNWQNNIQLADSLTSRQWSYLEALNPEPTNLLRNCQQQRPIQNHLAVDSNVQGHATPGPKIKPSTRIRLLSRGYAGALPIISHMGAPWSPQALIRCALE
jgi:hypothetical protein